MKKMYEEMQFDPIDEQWTMDHVIKLSLENQKPGAGNEGTLEVSKIYESSEHIRVIKGKPGAGKTTLMRKISNDWSLGKIKEFSEKILVLVIIRDLHQNYSVENIINQSCSLLSSRKREYLLQCLDSGQGEDFVFLLDGLDEYQDKDSNAPYIEDILSENKLKKATIIATSRYSAYLLKKIIRKNNACYLEIKGFLEDEVFDYFKERFKEDNDKCSEVKRYLTENPNMVRLCYIPLHCAIMANIFEEHEKKDQPKTETQFFEMHTRCRIVRSVHRQGDSSFQPLTLDELEGKNKELFDYICKLAYHATMENTQSLDEKDLKRLKLKRDNFRSDQANINGGQNMLGLLVITPDKPRGLLINKYSFTHLAVQEFCAAFHIAKLPQQSITEIIKDEKRRNRLNSVWKFICGLLDFTKNCALQAFHNLMEEYTNERKNLLFKIQCAHETQEKEPCIDLYNSIKVIEIPCMTPPELSFFMGTMKILGSANTELPNLERIR